MCALYALAIILAFFVAPIPASADELTIDGSSQETFEASVREMTEGLNDEDAKAFATGLMNLILTEYPPAKGQEGLSILFFGEEAVKAAPRTLDGKTRDEILARGVELDGGGTDSTDASPTRACLQEAIVIHDATVIDSDYAHRLSLILENRLPWAISGLRYHYAVRTEGRAVPWDEETGAREIPGGIEPGELRAVDISLSIPPEAMPPLVANVDIVDVADQDKQLLVGGVQVMGWGEELSNRTCDPAALLEAEVAPAPDPAQSRRRSRALEAPVGPPLTREEKDAFRLAVQRCWNVPAGLRDALGQKVTIGAELGADGQIINASIELLEPYPSPDGRTTQLYEAARRALLRCSPFIDLPLEKYGQWRYIEVVANPEGIVSW